MEECTLVTLYLCSSLFLSLSLSLFLFSPHSLTPNPACTALFLTLVHQVYAVWRDDLMCVISHLNTPSWSERKIDKPSRRSDSFRSIAYGIPHNLCARIVKFTAVSWAEDRQRVVSEG